MKASKWFVRQCYNTLLRILTISNFIIMTIKSICLKFKSVNFNFFCLLIIITAGVFYSIIWENAPFVTSDTSAYVEVAADLRDGKLDELHVRTIGYPLLLLVACSLEPTRRLFIIQLSLYLFSVFLLLTTLNKLRIAKQFTLIFLLLSLIPPSVVYTTYILAETFTTFLIVTGAVSLFWYVRSGKIPAVIISGVMLAFSAIVRPASQLLFVALTGTLLIFSLFSHIGRKRIIIAAISLTFLSCLILGGYSWYNVRHFGYFGLSPIRGFYLSTRTVRVIDKLPDEYKDVREILIKESNRLIVEGIYHYHTDIVVWNTFPELQRATGLNFVGLDNYLLKMNLLLIKKAPLEYLTEVGRAVTTYWLPSTTDVSNFNSGIIQIIWGIIHFITIIIFFSVTTLIFSLLLLTWYLPIKVKRHLSSLIKPYRYLLFPFFISISIIIYNMLVSTFVTSGLARFRVPTDLLIFFALTIGVYFFAQIGPHNRQFKNRGLNK